MKSELFSTAGCFCFGILLSNLTYLIPQYFWLCTIAGVVLAIGLCFPGTDEILRRWSALAVLVGIVLNNWELLSKLTALQFGIGAVAIFVTAIIAVATIGAIGGRHG